MGNIFKWLRMRLGQTLQPDDFHLTHYEKFERALAESDLEVYIYDNINAGRIVVLQDSELHPVTVDNLVDFRKMNRMERRHYRQYIGQWGD